MGIPNNRDVIVAINYAGETLKIDQEINLSNVQEGDTFTDVIGNSKFPYAVVKNKMIYIELPSRSYSVWVKDEAPRSN